MMKRWISIMLLLTLLLGGAQAAEKFSAVSPQDAQEKALQLVRSCAFGSEYGNAHNLARWEQPLRVYVGGKPTQADLRKVDEFLLELTTYVSNLPNVTRVSRESDANVVIWYVPLAKMGDYVDNYRDGNWGFVSYWFNGRLQMTRMEIAIATDVTDQKARNHLLMEEMLGGMGVGNDHYVYSDSILYQPWTTTQSLSAVDWLMMNMVYHPDVYTNMTWDAFYRVTSARIYNR